MKRLTMTISAAVFYHFLVTLSGSFVVQEWNVFNWGEWHESVRFAYVCVGVLFVGMAATMPE